MDSSTQSFAVYSPITQLNSSTAAANQLHASVNDSSWHHARISGHAVSLTPGPSPSMFPLQDRPPDLEYPSPAPSNASPAYSQHSEQYATHPQSPSVHMSPSNDSLLSQFSQVESRVGPSRVMTRRQRAQMEQKSLGRRGSLHQHFHRTDQVHPPRLNGGLYQGTTRLHTPNNEDSAQFQRDRLSLNTASSLPVPLQSPNYHPMTPTSMTSPSYPYHVYGHSRTSSGSTSNNHRAPSPALSCVSALTSVSSASAPASHAFSPYPRPTSNSLPNIAGSKPKQKKQRLDNNARKNICIYHSDHPNARQEDIAVVFKVERSTISKILKHKHKWLNTPDNQGDRVAKHRPSKFPEIEDELEKWLEDCTQKKTPITDNSIRARAKETARRLHIAEEKFKASSGWVENFKSRHNIRGGAWLGHEQATTARILVDGSRDSVLSPLNPAFTGRTDDCDINATSPHHDDDMDSQGSPGTEDQECPPAGEHHMSVPQSMRVQTAWADHSNGVSPTQPMSQSPLSAQHAIEPSPAVHDRLSSHAPESEHAVQQTQYINQAVYYHPDPPAPAALPTMEDAEAAMNTLITFIDTARRDLLLPEERRTLNTIRYALFQEANNIPFDRSTQA
ncbi:hypothetical protein D9615_002955 [Tricholomella constricta]|uniref:HTH CENPB-type domain-containing protein n=1 Tax=Tricholomella constricta TaxID=117010 RepID=A0A8H5M6I4_9AGAR|nr:hypothetical protein D9615_002955 [Tricholomella constricta]